jgi:hypothetical protein
MSTNTTFFKDELVCLNCGSRVHIAISKNGNKYSADIARASIHGGHFSPAHRCDLWDANDASLGFQQRMINQGEIIVGAKVEVFKGRKVPKGTIGEIFWMDHTGFGVTVGLKLQDGSKVFTAITNVQSTIKQGE